MRRTATNGLQIDRQRSRRTVRKIAAEWLYKLNVTGNILVQSARWFLRGQPR